MPVPTLITELSQTPATNSPPGSESPSSADDYLRTYSAFIALLRDGKGFANPVTLASAATVDIGAANSFAVEISGAVAVTSFGTNYNGPRFVRFTGAMVLTHSATLNLPNAANITTAAGDTCIAHPNLALSGWNVVQFQYVTAAAARTALGVSSTAEGDTRVQAQTATAFTTAGIATAYTLTPSPVITAYAAGQSFFVNFALASGAAPTLAISGVATPPNLVRQITAGTYQNIAAAEIPINHRSRVSMLSASQALVETMPPAAASTQKVLQVIEATPYSTASSTTVQIPNDDTIPQNTEGAEIQTVTITPGSASNRLRVEFAGFFGSGTSVGYVGAAMFQDSIANALTGAINTANDNVAFIPLAFSHEMAAGTTSPITFRIRFGPGSAITAYVNQNGAVARKFGGVMACRLRVTEIA